MATWHAVLKDWGTQEEISIEAEQVTRVQQAITAWMAQKRRILANARAMNKTGRIES